MDDTRRLSRAYKDPSRFTAQNAPTRIAAGTLSLIQPVYSGLTVRADDTVGAKLARLIALSPKPDAPRSGTIVLIDLSLSEPTPPLDESIATGDSPIVCGIILDEEGSTGQLRQYELPTACTGALGTKLVVDPSMGGQSVRERIRLSNGHLNEIGHRLVAETLFSQLVALSDSKIHLLPPPLYRKRINIHPENNERLASIRQPDS